MIIDKVKPYWTEEDKQRLKEIRLEEDRIINDLNTQRLEDQETGELSERARDLLFKMDTVFQKGNDLYNEVDARYIKSHTKKELLADAEEIINALEKADFLAEIANWAKHISKREDSFSEMLKKYHTESYENCYLFISHKVEVQLNALAGDEKATAKIQALTEKRVSLWYIKPNPAFLPMAHGTATDALAYMNTRNASIDPITGNATIEKLGVQLVILKLKELRGALGMSTDKLFSTAVATFTQQNHLEHAKPETLKREVIIDLKNYAQLLGYDVLEHETTTPEEAEREKKRAKAQLDNARKAINKDLDILHASTLTWREPIKGKTGDFIRISLVSQTRISNGKIGIAFTPEIASYLADKNIITQYPTKLLGLDNRNHTAYYIGRKLSEHYNIDNNQIKGTHDRLSIPALLAVTDLPTYEYIQKTDRGHWVERIKEPLERALDTLTQEGILKDWKYTHARGIDLTEEEAYNITRYEDFSKLYILFSPADTVDHTERITKKQKAKAEAKKRGRDPAKKKKQ